MRWSRGFGSVDSKVFFDVFFETLKQASVNCAEEPAKFTNAITSED